MVMAMVDCAKCIHKPVCDLWRSQESQDASCFQLGGCDYFKDCTKDFEIVRCHECKHWKNEINGCTEDKRFCNIGFYMVHKDGYCSFGERK